MPASSLYVASPEGDTGKSTVALGLLHHLAANVAKVGVFRPITRLDEERDYILDLLLPQTDAGLPYEDCVGVSTSSSTRTRMRRSRRSSAAITRWPTSATRW